MSSSASDERARLFRDLMKDNAWRSAESTSGIGSELKYTAVVRAALPYLIRELRVRSILDIPCGDWNWMRTVDLSGIDYLGADVVPSLVEANARRFGRQGVRFARLDVVTDRLPRADLVLCRDCLGHLPDDAVHGALDNLRRSRGRHVLLTTFPGRVNDTDIRTGQWRPINLQAAPFLLPPPLLLLDEQYDGDGGRFTDKSLGLWSRRELRIVGRERRRRRGIPGGWRDSRRRHPPHNAALTGWRRVRHA